ncbi:DUF2860 domain-containing protein [Vibrio sp. T187]|uniref:DUF2860 domain-containing protein n=1 Tax=Vibrio TaxID=662 RepID=UPI0010CA10FC|nr:MULTISPECIES: DUF2860 domain-containing protein [Vibrio]MBW3698406.1 DUF2860 domain-containing protein [Vibrio sp. T187]
MKTIYTLIAASIIAAPAMAQLSDEAGFSGEISINSGFRASSSNFDTDGDSTITSNTQSASSDTNFVVAPLGSIAYTFGQSLNQQVYVGTSREDVATGTVVLEVGYKYQLESGTIIDASLLPTVMSGKTWEDPYKTGSARTETDETGNAFRLKFDKIAGSNFSLDTAYATKDVENDLVTDKALKRDSKTIYVKGQYRQPLSRTSFLLPSIIYQSSSADGDANSYDQLGAELSLFKVMQRHQLALTAGYSHRSYDAAATLTNFDKKRSDNNYSLFAAYEYKNFMDWQDWSFIGLAGYGAGQSNITFYDQSETLVSVGLNYQF